MNINLHHLIPFIKSTSVYKSPDIDVNATTIEEAVETITGALAEAGTVRYRWKKGRAESDPAAAGHTSDWGDICLEILP